MAGEQPGIPDESPGGLGDGSTPEGIRDTRLYARAIRERWPIPDSVRPKIIKRLVKIVDDDAWTDEDEDRPGNREVVAAVRALISADRLNLDQERLDLEREKFSGTEEGTIKAAQELIAAREALASHKAAERPEP